MVLGNVANIREQKKIEQPNGKLIRRKVMRRKRPLPTAMSPLSNEGNRRISSQNQISRKPSPNRLAEKYFGQQYQNSTDHYEVKVKQKVRRKKIPVMIQGNPSEVTSSKVVTYKPRTTPMVSGNPSVGQQENPLNRTEDEKRCKFLQVLVAWGKF